MNEGLMLNIEGHSVEHWNPSALDWIPISIQMEDNRSFKSPWANLFARCASRSHHVAKVWRTKKSSCKRKNRIRINTGPYGRQ
ncbi:hypothetical protein Y1Q_0011290 [Alligator mississippiensis]|uniref:Uncharacterized protein n=1 Tax=Alligator mississippiensis TaxID=8496 RepID=A0A151N850_ALLMI|nr:hypothetical protein Y1Q_0011290 [Alligator mississippiensis]